MPLLRIFGRPRILALAVLVVLLTALVRLGSSHPAVQKYLPPSLNRIPEHGEFAWEEYPESSRWTVGDLLGGRRRLLVTGGQALIPRLLADYEVHVLDIVPRPSFPPSLIYHRGSIEKAFSSITQNHDFDGIIHLASISLDAWCAPKEEQCRATNVGGIEAVLAQRVNKRWWPTQKDPWIILGSSMDVFGNRGGVIDEESQRRPQSALGRTMLAAESAFENTLPTSPHAIIRFSDVYGYPHHSAIPQTFIPSLLTNALSSLLIQYDTDAPAADLLYVDDAVDGVLRAVARIESQAKATNRQFETFNLVSGKRWTQEELQEVVRGETQTMALVRDVGNHRASLQSTEFSHSKASSMLEWEPTTQLPSGLSRTLATLRAAAAEYSKDYVGTHCSTPQEADERNKALYKLDGCVAQLGFDHGGFIHFVKCSDGKHCTVDGDKVVSYNWNQSTFIVRQVGRSTDRHISAALEEENGMGFWGFNKDTTGETVQMELFDEDDAYAQLVFDFEVQPDTSYMRLLIPGTSNQLHVSATPNSEANRVVIAPSRDDHFDMRMTLLCCPFSGKWPLLLDDFESADARFGTTGQIPFNASRRSHICSRSAKAAEYNGNSPATPPLRPPPPLGKFPDDWAIKDLPNCFNDCDSPTICIQTGSCRCVFADHCGLRRDNPLHILFPFLPEELPQIGTVLSRAVSKLDWRDMLLPEARVYLEAHPDFIKLHVVDSYPGQDLVEQAECHRLLSKHCFSADSILYRAMRLIQTTVEEAELIVLPVYQQCTGVEFLVHPILGLARETIPQINTKEKTVSFVLTHDWGVCVHFAWEIWSARNGSMLMPEWIMRNALVWSVMGDYDSPCYRPHMDVVIPARSCVSYDLFDLFPTVESVVPARDRPQLVTWAGTYWGTGKNTRLRLTCDRGGTGSQELSPGSGLPQSEWYTWDYMTNLRNARFCPQPRGIAGWSPRVNDAIWAGCIPVLLAEGTHYAFADMLDWTKFSIRVHPTELDHIEQILLDIPLSRVEELQANLALMRDAFLYSKDETPEDELLRRGPMFFALHSAGMRVRTQYPAGAVAVGV